MFPNCDGNESKNPFGSKGQIWTKETKLDFKRVKIGVVQGEIETQTIDLQMVKWLKMQNFSSFQLAENFQIQVRLAV